MHPGRGLACGVHGGGFTSTGMNFELDWFDLTPGVVRPSRVSEPIRQHCEFTVSPSHLDRAQAGAQPAPLALGLGLAE